MKEHAEEVIKSFATVARPIMREFMSAGSCIGSVRITLEVLRRYGLRVIEIPVKFSFHVPAKQYVRVSGFSREERRRMRANCKLWRDDLPPEGRGWNGHLVALVEDRWLLDPSIDQAESDEFDVPVPREVLVIDTRGQEWNPHNEFEMRLGLRMDNGDEVKLTYRRTRNRTYMDTPAWNDEGLILLAAVIADRMRQS